jgi:hypothetical protein
MSEPNLYFQALQAKTHEEAQSFRQRLLVEVTELRPDLTPLGVRELINSNLGYDLGYLDDETRERALELYPEAVHPILGRTFGDLDTHTLLLAGKTYAEAGLEAARKVVADARGQADCAGATEVIEMINKGTQE